MDIKFDSNRSYHPNILTISGNGRNVGKTTLACNIIKEISQNARITAIKISPHFHEVDYATNLLEKPGEYIIYQEDRIDRNKDSSKMLAAGADRVLFIQTYDKYLDDLWNKISGLINNESPVIIESGGIHNIIEPGIALILTCDGQSGDKQINREEYIEIDSCKNHIHSILNRIEYADGHWTYQ